MYGDYENGLSKKKKKEMPPEVWCHGMSTATHTPANCALLLGIL